MKTKIHILLLLFIFFSFIGFSQDGSPDLSFGNDGFLVLDIEGGSDIAYNLGKQSDDKLIVVGGSEINGENQSIIIRFLPNGDLDTTFGNNGFSYNNNYSSYNFAKIQNDDKIIVGANYYDNGVYSFSLTRFLPNGDVDISFANNGTLNPFSDGFFKGIIFQDNETFTVAGRVLNNAIYEIALKRFFINGTIDTSFGNNGTVTTAIGNEATSIKSFELLNDGKIIVAAKITDYNSSSYVLLKYLFDGSLDENYGSNGVLELNIDQSFGIGNLAVYEDDKAVLMASIWDPVEETRDIFITRYLPNGSIDTSFNTNGSISIYSTNLLITRMIVQGNQRLLVYGVSNNPFEGGGPTVILRYDINGNMDTSFNFSPLGSEQFVGDMILKETGEIVCLSSTPWYNGPEDIVLESYNNNPLGISENIIKRFTTYPNPSDGIFNISHDFSTSDINYQISDITGKIIHQGTLSNDRTQIDISQFENGIYLFTSEGSTIRLVKY